MTNPESSTMKSHASIPEFEDVKRMSKVEGWL